MHLGSVGKKPIDIAPLLYESSNRKNWKVAHVLDGDAWIANIDLQCFLHGAFLAICGVVAAN
jgi:hypothetical protein